mgnify:CR=1 FL=1
MDWYNISFYSNHIIKFIFSMEVKYNTEQGIETISNVHSILPSKINGNLIVLTRGTDILIKTSQLISVKTYHQSVI